MEVRPPKYYDRLYDLEQPKEMKKIKDKRKEKQEREKLIKYSQTTLYIKEQLQNEENTKKGKAAALKRTKVE